jgi:hypothetical protein
VWRGLAEVHSLLVLPGGHTGKQGVWCPLRRWWQTIEQLDNVLLLISELSEGKRSRLRVLNDWLGKSLASLV